MHNPNDMGMPPGTKVSKEWRSSDASREKMGGVGQQRYVLNHPCISGWWFQIFVYFTPREMIQFD